MKAARLLNENTGAYLTDDDVIRSALAILAHRFTLKGPAMNSPATARDYLQLSLACRDREVFACIYLDAQNRVIAFEELFAGTLTQTSVYPREVVKACLRHNCAGVLLAHNHPSGQCEPSRADQALTTVIRKALELVDVHVRDHIIVAGAGSYSFAEHGLL